MKRMKLVLVSSALAPRTSLREEGDPPPGAPEPEPTHMVGCLMEDGVPTEIVLGPLDTGGLRLERVRIELDWDSE